MPQNAKETKITVITKNSSIIVDDEWLDDEN